LQSRSASARPSRWAAAASDHCWLRLRAHGDWDRFVLEHLHLGRLDLASGVSRDATRREMTGTGTGGASGHSGEETVYRGRTGILRPPVFKLWRERRLTGLPRPATAGNAAA
jgi:hypothetical protein